MKVYLLWDDSEFEPADSHKYGILELELYRDNGILRWSADCRENNWKNWGYSFWSVLSKTGLSDDIPILKHIKGQAWVNSDWAKSMVPYKDEDAANIKPLRHYLK